MQDYPEPQRNDILDLLFKPNFGASLHHLKAELGGDVNSTDGTEPSYARTREEFDHPRPEYFDRGYEWWLMREAKRRNPHIMLDVLQWGAPDWIGDRDFPDFGDPNRWLWSDRMVRNAKKFYTQDNADFIAGFIQGAKQHHGVDIDFCGIWNETLYDTSWIKLLRTTLDRRGLSRVGIVAADEIYPWTIANALQRDDDLKKAVRVVGAHYPDCQSTPAAKHCGRPLWASEDGRGRPCDWAGACSLAKALNRNYITGRMTKTVVWSLITAYYDSLPAPGSGPIKANTPWSGHYEIHPTLWIIAHTTQFAQPGWQYLDDACGLMPGGGSYVCLRSPDASGDYSVIIETVDAKTPQAFSFCAAGGLAAGPLHVWRSNQRSQFDRQGNILPTNGSFTMILEPGSVYSLTTTAGQQKGAARIPPPARFPLPYRDDFESYRTGRTPKYFSDQGGAFEAADRPDGGKCLRQVIIRRGIDWHFHATPDPYTMIGSREWHDYEVSCAACVEKSGYAALFGRITSSPQSVEPPKGYSLKASTDGHWELKAFTQTLASGNVPFAADRWHKLALRFAGRHITALIDGAEVKTLEDRTFDTGMAALGSGWNNAMFDDFTVRATGELKPQ